MKIAIDPGHGMSNRVPGKYDPGAVSGGVAEADIALQMALTLKHVLRAAGIDAILTRRSDVDGCPIGIRARWAQQMGCTHFLSLHCNAAITFFASGTETFYRDSRDEDFAEMVQDVALKAWGFKDRGIKHESQSQHKRLAVFDFDGPTCLLEMGFITNPANRKMLLDRDARIRFAVALMERLK